MKQLVPIVFLLALTACMSAEEKNILYNARLDEQRNAPQALPKLNLDTCVNDYKKSMNDPSSFSIAGIAEQDSNMNEYIWNPHNHQVAYSVQIRGKNGFGALMLKRMYCTYSYDVQTKKLEFIKSLSL